MTIWCERGAACQLVSEGSSSTNPKAHYVFDCPDDVEGAFNLNVDCPGEWWKCDGKNVCPRSSDHVVPCKGDCGDMVGPDRVEDYHKRICETDESFIGCGQTYRNCSETQKQAHSRLGDRCPLSNDSGNPGGTTGTNPITANPPAGTTNPPADPPRPCGHSTSASGDHSLQASCSSTDANGNTCTATSFYACSSHTHSYPAPPPPPTTVACGGASYTGCSGASSRTEHHVPSCSHCNNGYWTCGQYAYRHTTENTCRRPGCGVTYYECQNGACSSDSGTHDYHWAQ